MISYRRLKLRRGTATQWSTSNPVLADGEPGWDSSNGVLKIGDGTTAWGSLPAIGGGGTFAVGSDAWLKLYAGGDLEAMIVGAVTRDSNDAATSAGVIWPDGTTGTYTATTVSTAFPGAVDAFTVTYVGATTKTVTQPAVTRSASGAVTTRPVMTVA